MTKLWLMAALALVSCDPDAIPVDDDGDAGPRPCRAVAWDAPCPGDLVCDRGECVAPCSTNGGGCEEGVCVDGRCVAMCPSIAWPDRACAECAWDVFDAEDCTVVDRCRECADCAGARPAVGEPFARTCACLARPECAGCESEADGYWSCVLDACPSCRE